MLLARQLSVPDGAEVPKNKLLNVHISILSSGILDIHAGRKHDIKRWTMSDIDERS